VIASRNRAISLLRKRQPEWLDEATVAWAFKVEENVHRKLIYERMINTAPIGVQALFKMAFYQDMSHSEIAATTAIPLGPSRHGSGQH
jgi:DNA-directed RNA polymerase specialized sigma24 family protein